MVPWASRMLITAPCCCKPPAGADVCRRCTALFGRARLSLYTAACSAGRPPQEPAIKASFIGVVPPCLLCEGWLVHSSAAWPCPRLRQHPSLMRTPAAAGLFRTSWLWPTRLMCFKAVFGSSCWAAGRCSKHSSGRQGSSPARMVSVSSFCCNMQPGVASV